MKIRLFAALVAAASLSAMVPSIASATEPTPPPPSGCGGNACPGTQTFTVGGTSLFQGFGGSVFEGDEGYNLIEKSGSGGVNIEMSAGGGLCGVDCSDGGFTFEGYASESVIVKTGAFGEQSGVPVMAQNQGGAQAAVNFTVQKLTNAPE